MLVFFLNARNLSLEMVIIGKYMVVLLCFILHIVCYYVTKSKQKARTQIRILYNIIVDEIKQQTNQGEAR
jgi:hypothetical protein